MKIIAKNLTTPGIRRAIRSLRVTAGMVERIHARIQFEDMSPDQAADELGEILTSEPALISRYLGTPPDPTPHQIADELQEHIDNLMDASGLAETDEAIRGLKDYQKLLRTL